MPGHRAPGVWIAVVASLVAPLAGCATEVALDRDVYKFAPKLILKQGEFRVVRTLRGQASCPYFLYIDPPPAIKGALGISASAPALTFALGDGALKVRAMQDLHSKHDLLGKPQILHNFVEEWTTSNYLGFYAIVRLTVTAEVLEFTEQTR